VGKPTRLDLIAETAGVPVRIVRELNPEYFRGVTPPRAHSLVLLPRGLAAGVRDQIAALPMADLSALPPSYPSEGSDEPGGSRRSRSPFWKPPARRHVHTQKGETLENVARRCGVSVATLVRLNHLPPSKPLTVGQVVRLPWSSRSAGAVQAPGSSVVSRF